MVNRVSLTKLDHRTVPAKHTRYDNVQLAAFVVFGAMREYLTDNRKICLRNLICIRRGTKETAPTAKWILLPPSNEDESPIAGTSQEMESIFLLARCPHREANRRWLRFMESVRWRSGKLNHQKRPTVGRLARVKLTAIKSLQERTGNIQAICSSLRSASEITASEWRHA